MEHYERQALTEQQYATMCEALDLQEFKYEKVEDKNMIQLGFQGDQGEILINIHFDVDRCLLSVMNLLPVSFGKEEVLATIAIAHTNYQLLEGWFLMDPESGKICFKLTSSYYETNLDHEHMRYMIALSYEMSNKYAGIFHRLANGTLSLQDYLQGKTE